MSDADAGLVAAHLACPKCGERRVTALLNEDDRITCCACNNSYLWPDEDEVTQPERDLLQPQRRVIRRGTRKAAGPKGGCL